MMKTDVTIAVDPGKQGAIAVAYPKPRDVGLHTLRKASFQDVLDIFHDIMIRSATEGWHCRAWFEMPPKTLGKRVPESAAMVFGFHCGELYGMLRTLRLPLKTVRPPEYLKYPPEVRKAGATAKKRYNKDKAAQMFPWLKIPVEAGDALLLLNYAMT